MATSTTYCPRSMRSRPPGTGSGSSSWTLPTTSCSSASRGPGAGIPRARRAVGESIADERALLGPLRDRADLVIDTGELNVNQLRTRLMEVFGSEEAGATMHTSVVSFGFKYGVPLDVDLMFDCRFLPNPYWDEALRNHSGLETRGTGDSCSTGRRPTSSSTSSTTCCDMLIPAYVREGTVAT